MTITFDISDGLLYLELLKRNKRSPDLSHYNFILYYTDGYNEVKEFYDKIQELKFRPPFVFYNASLIHFIEDYLDCVNLKDNILKTQQNRRRRYSMLFIQQIMLSESKQQAAEIIKEAKDYGIDLGEVWAERYDSIWRVKNDQVAWRENIDQLKENHRFTEIYREYLTLKTDYFKGLLLIDLRQATETIVDKNNKKTTLTMSYMRSIYVKEFAKRVANGVCQLCENFAPFLDKHGNPFLEVHHIKYLSEGGSDTIENVVALCPNCHRKVHILELDDDKAKLFSKATENSII